MSRLIWTASALLLIVNFGFSQNDKPPEAKPEPPGVKPAVKPADKPPTVGEKPSTGGPNGEPGVEVQFSDGSLVKLTLLDAKFEITTRYGKLSVPIAEVRKIEMGLRYPEGSLQKIQTALGLLGDPDFKKREAATNDLLAYGERAYPIVRRALPDGNAEAQKRIKTVLEEMRKRIPEEKLLVKDYDTVVTAEFSIAGRIEAASLKASSPLLGNVDVKLFQVRGIRWLGHTSEVQVTVDAAKYGGPGESWMDTGIDLNGDKLNAQATGTVDVMPNNPGQFMAGPDGMRQDIGFRRGGPNTVGPPGALVGKVGQSGRPFLVGSRYEATPSGEGRLFLKLEPSPWNINQSGSFSVKIVTGK